MEKSCLPVCCLLRCPETEKCPVIAAYLPTFPTYLPSLPTFPTNRQQPTASKPDTAKPDTASVHKSKRVRITDNDHFNLNHKQRLSESRSTSESSSASWSASLAAETLALALALALQCIAVFNLHPIPYCILTHICPTFFFHDIDSFTDPFLCLSHLWYSLFHRHSSYNIRLYICIFITARERRKGWLVGKEKLICHSHSPSNKRALEELM